MRNRRFTYYKYLLKYDFMIHCTLKRVKVCYKLVTYTFYRVQILELDEISKRGKKIFDYYRNLMRCSRRLTISLK